GWPALDPTAGQLVLSPHLDDAVLSSWSTLTGPGDVEVANLFTGRPAPGVLTHYDRIAGATSSAELMARREREDRAALATAGRRPTNLGLLEDEYRRRAPALDGLLRALGARVPRARSVLAPVAIGLHPDHVLARDVALALLRAGWPVALYADLPYCATYGWPPWVTGEAPDPHLDVEAHWEPALDALRRYGIAALARARRLDVDEQAAKLAALRRYVTQYPTLTRGPLDVLAHPAVLGYEVTWSLG
ncbi:MAG: PIG-L family deacetylase, partial [Actinomycetota bacterium]|nr:PIG-L family deacetylase [Actinomycetota bacterium]